MATDSQDTEEKLYRKRPRKPSQGDSEEPLAKRLKKEKVILPEEISIQTYFSLSSQELIDETYLARWDEFIKIISRFLFHKDIYIDDSNPRVIYVPQKILTILKKMNYNEISLEDLEIILEERQNRLVEVLHKLKHSRKNTKQERENFFAQLKQFVEEGVLNLTLTLRKAGWNILHAIIGFGRVDVLIYIQRYLLPELHKQYEELLDARTSRSQKTPGSMITAPYYEETSSLLREESLPLLKKKQLIVILGMLVSHKEELQCITLYEQLKELIAEGADPTITEDTRGLTVLHYAAYKRNIELVKHTLQHASLKQCEILLNAKTNTTTQSTAASIAEYNKNEEIIYLLKEKEGQIAKSKEELIEIFRDLKLLKKKTEADKQVLYERIEQFIKNSGNPTATDDRGLTFLHYAAVFQDIILGQLIKNNAEPEEYRALLSVQSEKQQLRPYDIVFGSKKKSSEYESLLQLLNPEANQSVSQSSQQSYGQVPFFSPTRLSNSDEVKPELELSQSTSSLTRRSPS